MNQNNWEKTRDEASKIHSDKMWGDFNAIARNMAADNFKAGADFGRAYSQGGIDRLTEESYAIAPNANRLNDQVNQLTQENAELKTKLNSVEKSGSCGHGHLQLRIAELETEVARLEDIINE